MPKHYVYPQGLDRPIVGAVVLDPAYVGPAGLAVGRWGTSPASWQGDIFTTSATRWLGDAVCAVCKPGERLVLVAEASAYGGFGIARMLGIAVGVAEGCLIDLNAVEPRTRVDVMAQTWRGGLGIRLPRGGGGAKATRRAGLKLQAVERARDIDPGITMRDVDRAEALCIWTWANLQPWGKAV